MASWYLSLARSLSLLAVAGAWIYVRCSTSSLPVAKKM